MLSYIGYVCLGYFTPIQWGRVRRDLDVRLQPATQVHTFQFLQSMPQYHDKLFGVEQDP